MSRRLLVIFALLAIAFAVLTALAFQRGVLRAPGAAPQGQTAAVGGPFQLVDQNGRTVDQSVLKGKWSAVFFGFTYCPDACPTTLLALGQAEKLLKDRANGFQTVFVSVDPARDTPEQVHAYLANDSYPKRVIGLTGSQAQTDAAASAYRVYHQKAGEGEGYTVNHSTITYLMNPQGQFACVIPYGEAPEKMAEQIRAAMGKGSHATSC
jgi:protein SCO1/2